MKFATSLIICFFFGQEVGSFSDVSKPAFETKKVANNDAEHDEDLLTWHFLTPGGRHHHYADKAHINQGSHTKARNNDDHMDHVIPQSLLPQVAKKRRNKLGISFDSDDDDTRRDNDHDIKAMISPKEGHPHSSFRELLLYPDGIFPVSVSEEDVILQEKFLHAWGLSPPLTISDDDKNPNKYPGGRPTKELLP